MDKEKKEERKIEENVVPLLPVSNMVLFPKTRTSILIFDEKQKKVVFDSVTSFGIVGVFFPKSRFLKAKTENIEFFPVGCAGKVISFTEAGENVYSILIEGIFRMKFIDIIKGEHYDKVKFEILPDILPPEHIQNRLKTEIIEKASFFLARLGEDPVRIKEIMQVAGMMKFEEVVNWAIFLHPMKFSVKLELIEENDVEERAKRFLQEIEKDINYLKVIELYRPLKPRDPRVN
jgi:ATP-dependent Lon protease